MKTLQRIALMVLMVIATTLNAQDMILKKNSEIIHCKIKEVGLDEIKYQLPDYPADVVFSIDKDKIVKVIFENGKELEFRKEMTNPTNYEDNKKNAFKIDFLSPLSGNTTLYYERSLKPGRSIEGAIGLVGLGIKHDSEAAAGLFVKAGYKFIKDPDFYLRGMRYAHILKGSYVKPELIFGVHHRNYTDHIWDSFYQYNPVQRSETVVSGAIQIVFGKQWVFDNAFLVETFSGIGYGFTSMNRDNFNPYHYGYSVGGSGFPISASWGMKIGFLNK